MMEPEMAARDGILRACMTLEEAMTPEVAKENIRLAAEEVFRTR